MKKAILHANCQGEPLCRLLQAAPGFKTGWTLRHVVNYTKEKFQPDELATCDLFLYQYLGPEWGTLSSDYLLERLSTKAKALCLPNPFFKAYWPFWTNNSTMEFGDRYLDKLLDSGLEPFEAVHIYQQEKLLPEEYKLDSILEKSLALERRRQSRAFFQLYPYIEAHWQEEQVFETVNHPAPKLNWMLAQAVLGELGLPALPAWQDLAAAGLDMSCDAEFLLPISPLPAKHWKLPFAGKDRRYPLYGPELNWQEYALAYADCRRQGLNLFAYLSSLQK